MNPEMGCAETSVKKIATTTLRNIREERSSLFFLSVIDSLKFLKSPEPCEILGYFEASSGKFLPTFRHNPS